MPIYVLTSFFKRKSDSTVKKIVYDKPFNGACKQNIMTLRPTFWLRESWK